MTNNTETGTKRGLRRAIPAPAGLAAWYLLYLALIAAVFGHALHLGLINDGSGYVVWATHQYADHLHKPFLLYNDPGHPLYFTWINALIWQITGREIWVLNLSIWMWAAMAMLLTHLLTMEVLRRTRSVGNPPRWAGPLAALALFMNPLFAGHIVQYLAAMPNIAGTLGLLLGFVTGRCWMMLVFGLVLCFTRITGVMPVIALFVFDGLYTSIVLRQRSLKMLLSRLWPYIVIGILFGLYLFVKLYALDLPLSTYGGHYDWKVTWAKLADQLTLFKNHLTHIPWWGLRILFYPVGLGIAAAVALRACRMFRKRSVAGDMEPAAQPGNFAIYTAFGIICAAPLTLYLIASLYLQPRWFLPFFALTIVGAVHALTWLLGRARLLAIPLMLAWCMAQGVYWDQTHASKLAEPSSGAYWRWHMPAALSPDVIRLKRIYQDGLDWVFANYDNPAFVVSWGSIVYCNHQAGYTDRDLAVEYIGNMGPGKDTSYMARVIEEGRHHPLLVVVTNWESVPERESLLQLTRDYPSMLVHRIERGEMVYEIHCIDHDAPAELLRQSNSIAPAMAAQP